MKTTNKLPQLTLVGAGPGDAELITIKGMRAIESADYILYDALVNKELLKYARKSATLVFVGKRAGKHAYSQDEINEMIVLFASQCNHVVRLKGGDPYVFGRGYEELEYAQEHGLEVNVIPGITSAISVPSLAGIPLTKRGISESFWVVTGTTKSGELSRDIELVAQSTATAVILMGMKKLPQIIKIFEDNGKGDTAVAIIQNGSMPDEKRASGSVGNIIDRVEKGGLSSPAIIVIGEVAKLERQQVLQNFSVSELLVA